jgi:cytoskeletal protein RodZ
MRFGESLRKERELRGITLEEISQHTKVHTRFLEAIENDDLSVLPAKAFAKGFLRSYARMVGLDEDLVITNFEYCHRTMQTKGDSENSQMYPENGSHHRLMFLTLLLIIVVLVAIIILYYQGYLNLNWL